jgi:pyridoxal phosphate enzyme (YggS family)
MSSIAERLGEIRARIEHAAVAARRKPEEVRLVAVSKLQPTSALREAYAAGVRDFGENYVQELVRKADELADLVDLRFHLIGHLQTNKAKAVVGRVSAVHSVDSVRLAEELGKRAAAAELPITKHWPVDGFGLDVAVTSRVLPVFVEVNVGGEAQKSGCAPDAAKEVLAAIREQSSLRAVGLMTVPPFFDDPKLSRPYFDRLRQLRDVLAANDPLPELSMGMTLDLEEAIQAGATIVRVGTAIFGERPPREATSPREDT